MSLMNLRTLTYKQLQFDEIFLQNPLDRIQNRAYNKTYVAERMIQNGGAETATK